jgi:hypothetical protein
MISGIALETDDLSRSVGSGQTGARGCHDALLAERLEQRNLGQHVNGRPAVCGHEWSLVLER